eukprot:1182454-Prorocentrum_minimum.AAC.3
MGSNFCTTMTVSSRIVGTAPSTSAGVHRNARLATRPIAPARDSNAVSLASQFTSVKQVPSRTYSLNMLCGEASLYPRREPLRVHRFYVNATQPTHPPRTIRRGIFRVVKPYIFST